MTLAWRRIAATWLVALSGGWTPAAAAATAGEFECGGAVETQTWALWDTKARELLQTALLQDTFKAHGDTYVLYDLQAYLQQLVGMAVRCRRTEQLLGLARFLAPVFDELSELPRGAGPAWVCRGGRVCTAANRLLGTEVVLTSSQFLALLTRVASALAPMADLQPAAAEFVDRAARVALAHVDRWMAADGQRVAERLAAKLADVRDASSRLFFNDTDLWILAVHAEVAGIARQRPQVQALLQADPALSTRRRAGLLALLRLLDARTTSHAVESPWTGRTEAADLDRGYWRLYPDNRFAAYTAETSPMPCGPGAEDRKPPAVPVVETSGWDISHARRLVHALDAIDRQRPALVQQFDLPPGALPPADLARLFAAQMVAKVWNRDDQWPLFANFLDGHNGWYRAGYGGGGRGCFEGHPPYGLSDAFVTGGFVAWAEHYPVLRALGERLYRLSSDRSPAALAFLGKHYTGLAPTAGSSARVLTRIMFWPSLVQPKTESAK